jgi:hypothetical protein
MLADFLEDVVHQLSVVVLRPSTRLADDAESSSLHIDILASGCQALAAGRQGQSDHCGV